MSAPAEESGASLWRVAVAVPARAAVAFETVLEPFAVAVSTWDPDPSSARTPGKPAPASWAGDIWLAESCIVEAICETKPAAPALADALAAAAEATSVPLPEPRISPVEARDWIAETQRSFPPIDIGRYHLRGSHVEGPPPAGSIGIIMDAAAAFGTGEHETTRGCLLALDRLARSTRPRRILDMGCGSGILAVAAALTWRRPVVAADIDDTACAVAETNARINRVGGLVKIHVSDGYKNPAVRAGAPYDLVFANILARPLTRQAPALATHLAPGGAAILSGLLWWQEPQVLAAHRLQGLSLVRRLRLGDWSTLVVRRGQAA